MMLILVIKLASLNKYFKAISYRYTAEILALIAISLVIFFIPFLRIIFPTYVARTRADRFFNLVSDVGGLIGHKSKTSHQLGKIILQLYIFVDNHRY